MRIDIVSIFPEYFAPLDVSLLGKARRRGLVEVTVHDLRAWAHDRHRTVDDTPYGGGPGMVMKPDPWGEALDAIAPPFARPAEFPGAAEPPEPGPTAPAHGAGPFSEPGARTAVPPEAGPAGSAPWADSSAGARTAVQPEAGAAHRTDSPADAPTAVPPASGSADAAHGAGPFSEPGARAAVPSEAGPADAVRRAGNASDARPAVPRLIVPTPSGRPFTQALAVEYAAEPWLLFACGRYEGIDSRVVEEARDRMPVDEVGIGDYVLAGGEVAVLVMIEAISRLLPGVLGNLDSVTDDSFAPGAMEALLEGPVYTKPPVWRDRPVPEVLLSGNHGAIARWRRDQALRRTLAHRPDLADRLTGLDEHDRQILREAGHDPES